MLTDTAMISAETTELRIYPSFTEIRQEYDAPQTFKLYFARDMFNDIASGSLSVEGIPVQSKQIVTKTNNLEGKTVFLRLNAAVEPRECRVVRSDNLLLQDTTSKRFFSARNTDLEYVDIPEQEGTEVTYLLDSPGQVTLSYMIQKIRWSPHYYLSVLSDDGQHTFQGFADIINQTKQQFDVSRTELISGEAVLGRPQNTRYGFRLKGNLSESSLDEDEEDTQQDRWMDLGSLMPKIDSLPEMAGLYLYSINQPFKLLPNATFSVPFNNAMIRLTKFVGLTLPFNNKASQSGKMKRKYRIEAVDKFIPAGTLTIREQGRLIGTTSLPDMAVGDKQIIMCGEDPDVSINRQLKLISEAKNTAIYHVQLRFKNAKNRPIKVEYKELIDTEIMQFSVVSKGNDEQQSQIRSTANSVYLEANNDTNDSLVLLPANGEAAFEYELHLNYLKKTAKSKGKRKYDEED